MPRSRFSPPFAPVSERLGARRRRRRDARHPRPCGRRLRARSASARCPCRGSAVASARASPPRARPCGRRGEARRRSAGRSAPRRRRARHPGERRRRAIAGGVHLEQHPRRAVAAAGRCGTSAKPVATTTFDAVHSPASVPDRGSPSIRGSTRADVDVPPHEPPRRACVAFEIVDEAGGREVAVAVAVVALSVERVQPVRRQQAERFPPLGAPALADVPAVEHDMGRPRRASCLLSARPAWPAPTMTVSVLMRPGWPPGGPTPRALSRLSWCGHPHLFAGGWDGRTGRPTLRATTRRVARDGAATGRGYGDGRRRRGARARLHRSPREPGCRTRGTPTCRAPRRRDPPSRRSSSTRIPHRFFIAQSAANDAVKVNAPTAASPSSCTPTWCSDPV